MKTSRLTVAAVAVALLFNACKKDDTPGVTPTQTTNLSATLSAPTGVTGPSGASGTFAGSITAPTQIFSYTLNATGLQPSFVTLDPAGATGPQNARSILLGGNIPDADSAKAAADTTTVRSPLVASQFLRSAQADSLRNGLYQVTVRQRFRRNAGLLVRNAPVLVGTIRAQ